MNEVYRIWYILNEAVMGKHPVYNLACKMVGLPEDVIYDMAEKIKQDLHTKKTYTNSNEDWRKRCKSRIFQAKIKKIIENL